VAEQGVAADAEAFASVSAFAAAAAVVVAAAAAAVRYVAEEMVCSSCLYLT
jgi:hypothetical protein